MEKIKRTIHKSRVEQELLFQLFVRHEPLREKTVEELRELARLSQVLIGNYRYKTRALDWGPKFLVTDRIANDPCWITNLIEDKFS